MPRVKRTAEEAGQIEIHKTAGLTPAILFDQLQTCRAAMRACLVAAVDAGRNTDLSGFYYDVAIRLADTSARLADSIAKARGETVHSIRVERSGDSSEKERGATRSSVPNVPIGE